MLVELFTCEVKLIVTTSEKLTLENRGLSLYVPISNMFFFNFSQIVS